MMKRSLLISLAFSCIAAWPAAALPDHAGPPSSLAVDTLRGRITDSNGAPIAGASVTVVELSAATRSDANGHFAFGVPRGRYTLVIERMGFGAIARVATVPHDGQLEVSLEEGIVALPPVNVTATRSPTGPAGQPLAVATIEQERVRREHGVSLAQAVSHLAGAHVISTGEQIGKPVLRGLSGARVLVLENGHRVEDYSWSDEDGPSVDTRLEQRVEVIRGPASVLYGSDAIGGVVNALPAPLRDTAWPLRPRPRGER